MNTGLRTALISLMCLLCMGGAFAEEPPFHMTVQTKSVGELSLDCQDTGEWTFRTELSSKDGREFVKVTMDAQEECVPKPFSLSFSIPQDGISNLWSPLGRSSKILLPDWGGKYSSQLAYGAPLYTFFSTEGRNCLTLASTETFRRVDANLGLREEGCAVIGKLAYFVEPESPLKHYETVIMLDVRDEAWYEGVREGAEWIKSAAGLKPMSVPEAAFDPLYSSWYQFHQDVHDSDIEAECKLASELGMGSIILDDGWQTDDVNRGYAYCGDWLVSANRFKDMKAHVDRVHSMGMKYMMWYSVPFVGLKSEAYDRFKSKVLRVQKNQNAIVLDPRFPEVREYIAGTYEKAMLERGLDGFKLDFIDQFRITGTDPALADDYAGRDIKSVPAAVDVLMKDVAARLKKINPDVLIEFRQNYMGPAILQYGNMMRVHDCPGDRLTNRTGIADLRLTSGNAAVHADMLEWNLKETPEVAALNIISSIFGTVQYSVMLRDIPESHRKVIRNWIQFSQAHRDALLKGDFRPLHPELNYPVIEAENAAEKIVGVYADNSVAQASPAKTTWVLNGTMAGSLFVNLPDRKATAVAYDAFGKATGTVSLNPGCSRIAVPSGGRIEILPFLGGCVHNVKEKNTAATPLFDSHRGIQPFAPENTLASFEAAGSHGTWAIETDFRFTGDSVVICLHDKKLDRTIEGKGPYSDYSFADLRKMKSREANSKGVRKQYDYSSIPVELLRIPTMDEYLATCVKYGCVAFIELKDKRVLPLMNEAIHRYGLEGRCVISTSSLDMLRSYRDSGGKELIHLIFGKEEDIPSLLSMGNAAIAFNFTDYSDPKLKRYVRLCHSKGLKVCFRAVDTPEAVKQSIALGVDYMPSNNMWPALCR